MARPKSIRKTPSSPSLQATELLSPQELVAQIEAGRQAAAEARHEEAISYFEAALQCQLLNAEQRALVRSALAESLESLGRFSEAAELMSDYETPQGRAGLPSEVLFQVRLRLGSVEGYAGDHPRAISHLEAALKIAEERQDLEGIGACYLVLGRIYRAIGETRFARDYLLRALQAHRKLGGWAQLAQNYFLLGNVCISEGDFSGARAHFEQAIKLIGDRQAPLLLGSIYTSLSNLILLGEQGQASYGVEVLEKAIFYLKQAKNERLLAYAMANRGFGLVHLGQWDQAEQVLHEAVELALRVGDRAAEGTALDTLGELFMMRGEFIEAERFTQLALKKMQEARFPYGEVQVYQTLGRLRLAQGQFESALEAFEKQLRLASRLEDQRSYTSAKLHLAETRIEMNDPLSAQRLLDEVAVAVERLSNVSLLAHFQSVGGLLHAREGNYDEAWHRLSQAIAVFEMVSDQYRAAVAHYRLGSILAATGDSTRAREHFRAAQQVCARLGASPLLMRIEQALDGCGPGQERPPDLPLPPLTPLLGTTVTALSSAAMVRLIGASSSRELLLHELVTLIYEGTSRRPVVAFEEAESGQLRPVAICGGAVSEVAGLGEVVKEALEAGASKLAGAELVKLGVGEGKRISIYIGTEDRHWLPLESLKPLLKLAEMCLELCELREQRRSVVNYEAGDLNPDLRLPGLVFSSPAMRALVEDIHKIRSSRVTVLITGESGTGKEIVARAIHALSERRDAPFVPFNCTIVPREMIASQLFGHKKGAFTGAVSDYQGVIRSAAGGTLFLDEIGDLAPEVQPKLLRFLQEGEIQPLGETRLIRVDVRVIAATNADIERLVAEGKFREDLYYRLNVIRLHLPPLRERREELPLLVDHFLKLYSRKSRKEGIVISPQALDLLMVYDWPGNVRQLENEIQRLVAYKNAGEMITEGDLSPAISRSQPPPRLGTSSSKNLMAVTSALSTESRPTSSATASEAVIKVQFKPGQQKLAGAISELERQVIIDAMRRHKGKRSAVAEELGITRKGLYLKLRRYRIVTEQ